MTTQLRCFLSIVHVDFSLFLHVMQSMLVGFEAQKADTEVCSGNMPLIFSSIYDLLKRRAEELIVVIRGTVSVSCHQLTSKSWGRDSTKGPNSW